MIHHLTLGVILSATILRPAGGQEGAGLVTGVVTDSSGLPIMGAEVAALGTRLRARSDDRGQFAIPGLALGDALIEARRLGFRPETVGVVIFAERAAVAAIRLRTTPTTLATVAIRGERQKYSGRLAGYHERLASGLGGAFITRDQLDQGNPRQLTDVLRRVPGVEIVRGTRIRLRGRNCAPLVWLDGVSMPAGEVEINTFAPSSIEGIEVYMTASGAPGRYQATGSEARCGTVLLWSRGPDTEDRRASIPSAVERLEKSHAAGELLTAAEVDSEAKPSSPGRLEIFYPADLLATGVDGAVVAEFVVDTAGMVEAESFTVVSSTHPLFSHAVYDAVQRAVFSPARRAGRPVRQVVQMRFRFTGPVGRRPGR